MTRLAVGVVVTALLVAGCAGGEPVGSVGASTPPGPAASAPSPRSASLEPGTDEATRLESRLLEILDAPDLAYRFEQSADITSDTATLHQSATGEVAGPDLHITLTVTQGDQSTVSELAVLGGKTYQRDGTGPWSSTGSAGPGVSIVPTLDPVFQAGIVRYSGHEVHDGSVLQHLVVDGPVTLTDAFVGWLPSTATNGTLDSLDLYLEDDGRPADMQYKLTFDIQLDGTSDPVTLQGTYRQTFADLGQDVTVAVQGLP